MSEQGPPSESSASNGTKDGKSTAAALAVIRPDMSPLERRRRRRMLLQSMFITFFLTFSWIGGMIAVQLMSTSPHNFGQETRQVLERLRDGQDELVYEEASPLLRETMILARFRERADDIRSTMGSFQDILAMKRVESISGPGGETARVKASIVFERARTEASFSYHYTGGTWRLMGFNIVIPEELRQEASSKNETKVARKDAPAEIYALSEQVLARMAAGQGALVWQEAADIFKQSIDEKTFLERQKQWESILGPYQRIIDTMSATRSQSRSWASRSMLVQYKKHKTTVTISFRKRDEVWQLSYYKIEIPLPRIPSTIPERPPQ